MWGRPWTTGEQERLRELYGKRPVAEIARELGRTESAVMQRARDLGVLRRRNRAWTSSELAWLRENFATATRVELLAALDHPIGSVMRRAYEMGLKRPDFAVAGRKKET